MSPPVEVDGVNDSVAVGLDVGMRVATTAQRVLDVVVPPITVVYTDV